MTQDIHSVLDEAANNFFTVLKESGIDRDKILTLCATLFSNAILDIAKHEGDTHWIISICNSTKQEILEEYFKYIEKKK